MKRLQIFIPIFFLHTPCHTQTVYKCGNTFSQTPCASNAQKIEVKPASGIDCTNLKNVLLDACNVSKKSNVASSVTEERAKVQKQIDAMPPTAPPSFEAVEANKKRCLDRILAMLKDPESARVGTVSRAIGPAPDYQTTRGWFPSVSYTVSVNAKNSYGGYTGSKIWACSFDLSEKEIIRAHALE